MPPRPVAVPVGSGLEEEGIADLVGRLVDDSRVLVAAEIALYKARANERVSAFKSAAIFFVAAGVLAVAALIALLVGLILSLATLIGPLAATAVVVIAVLVAAAVLAVIGKGKLAPAGERGMTDPVADLRRAEVTAAEARRRLDTTVAETRRRVDATVADLQVRLHPRALAHDARQAGSAVALAGIDSAQRNPRVVAGVAAAAALLFIRGRIAAFRRRRRARKPVPAAPRTSPSRPEDAS